MHEAPVCVVCATLYGGAGEIRTLASISRPTPLAGEPLLATWVRLHIKPHVRKTQPAVCLFFTEIAGQA